MWDKVITPEEVEWNRVKVRPDYKDNFFKEINIQFLVDLVDTVEDERK